ncbi:hypothetical protein GCM10022216_14400 [Sphingobacterium kyonggiense]|uniref:Uncharacterized protein n=1 Tax=Sphingobacterium kyonggiense TaxID=714075 RepID=A0ABP7YL30_9SPHI
MNWNKIKAVFFKAMGITSLAENKLSAEQKEILKGFFGESALAKFEAGLASENPEEHSKGIYDAMKAIIAPEAEKATSELAAKLKVALEDNAKKDKLIAALSEEPEGIPQSENTEFQGKAGVPKVLNVMRKAAHYALVYGAMATGAFVSADAATIEVDQLKTEFGTYLSQNQTNLQIHTQIFNGFTSAEHFRTVPATTEYRATQAHINSVSQQFNAKWTPAGNAKFTPLTIKNYRHKINYPIVPAEVLDTYLLHLYDEGLSPDQMPITKYIINKLVFPKLMDDIEKRMVFKGKYKLKTDPNAASSPEDSMDGIETILIAEKANPATKMKFFTKSIDWATATDEQVVKFVEDFADFVDDDLKIKKIYSSKSVKKRYQRAYEKHYGTGSKVVGGMNKEAEVDYVEMEIHALDGMSKSPIIFATTPGNMVKLRNKSTPPNVINDVQKKDYEVRLFGEYWLGVGFEIAEFVFAYVPDSYTDAQQGLLASNKYPDGTSPKTTTTGSGAGGL